MTPDGPAAGGSLPRSQAGPTMFFSVTLLIGMPWLLSGLALGVDRYLKSYPAHCDDVWRLPRPSSLR